MKKVLAVLPVALPLALPFALEGQDDRPWFVSGIVVDGRSQLPIEGAEVRLVGERLAVVETALSGVEGLWGVSGDHLVDVVQVNVVAPGYLLWNSEGPVLRRGLRVELRREGDPPPPEPVDLSDEMIFARCGSAATPETAILAGTVVDAGSGEGVEGVLAVADWGALEPPRLVVGGSAEPTYRSAISEAGGLYLFCALPVDRPLRVWIRSGAGEENAEEVILEAGRLQTLRLTNG